MRQQNIRVERGNKGFGLSLIYKGLDKFPEEETGTFVAKVVPGGNSARAGLRPNDKVLRINNKVPRDVNDAVELIKRAGKTMMLTVTRTEEESSGQFSRSGSVRSFNTGYGGDSRPQTPTTSGDEDERLHVEQTRQQGLRQQEQLRQQEIQRQQEVQRQQEIQRQQEMQSQQELQRQQEIQRQQELQRQHEMQQQQAVQQQLARQQEQERQQKMEQQQQEYARQQMYERQLLQQAEHERQQQAEHERQMQAAEHERQQKLQAELDQAALNAGKVPGRRSRRDSSSDEEGWPPVRSKSMDGKRRNRERSKSPGSISIRSNKSWADLTDEAKLTRNEEKTHMQANNNRLANYIDRVRQLQTENRRMTKQIEVIEESQVKEIRDVRSMYDREVQDLKSAIDNQSRNYRELQTTSEKVLTDNRDLKSMQDKKTEEARQRAAAVHRLREEIQKLKSKIFSAESEDKVAKDKLKEVLPELGKLRTRTLEINRLLEDVKKDKKKLEDRVKDLNTDLKTKVGEMESRLTTVKTRKQMELIEIGGKLEKEYEDRVQKMLAELRDVYENQMKSSREEFTRKYEAKVSGLQMLLSTERAKNHSNHGDGEEAQKRIATLASKVNRLEAENYELNRKLEKLAASMDEQARLHNSQLAAKDGEIRQLLEKITSQREAYRDLMQAKTALDMEIAVYRKLVECEEDRLGITTNSFDTSDTDWEAASPSYRVTREETEERTVRRMLGQTEI